MFNSQRPRLEDLPTTGQLLRATGLAIISAGAILIAIVLPSEYAIDPTGVGRQLGLTKMGEIKTQLAEEAARDAVSETMAPTTTAVPAVTEAPTAAASTVATAQRSDTMTLTLAPGEGAEIKAKMTNGARLAFDWSVEGGHVNFDTHGDPENAPRGFYHGYGKGRESTGEKGELVAAFNGTHGWFWRNRSGSPVTITLRTEGAYSEIRRVV
ncbi:transmembrane anchor protein [Sphingosinicella sp.]|uniref:transmembrane anchor protein n=1 Tax=Sphingosinicella sp. TaxID=1917971 RepID=UPI0017D8E641|nr:transmembrane anchor protein [Sphingosinicella sp.]MBA4758151.1 transmembrane anchor protein [Sphingosinicella sp.]